MANDNVFERNAQAGFLAWAKANVQELKSILFSSSQRSQYEFFATEQMRLILRIPGDFEGEYLTLGQLECVALSW